MNDDLVTRLRQIGDELSEDYYGSVYEAAHEIERLRRELHAAVLIINHQCDDPENVEAVYEVLRKAAK